MNTKDITKGEIKLAFDIDKKFIATDEFILAIKNLMLAELKMMREVFSESKDSWYCGSAKITDLADAVYLSMSYGELEDMEWLKKSGQIFVTIEDEGLSTIQMQQRIKELEGLLSVSKCPDSNCDNNGTIAFQRRDGEWEPEPCQWCHEKQTTLNNKTK